MDNIINMGEFIGAAAGDKQHMLGKFLYFSLSNLLVEKAELSALCESMGIAYAGCNRLSVSDAFQETFGNVFRSPQTAKRISTSPTVVTISTRQAFSPASW